MGMTHLKNLADNPTKAVFGQDPTGATFAKNISDGPHWIVCGMTGSGKSVYINGLLVSMMYHAHPDELQIAWVDPKKVESANYIDCPFCPINPVTDMADAFGLMRYYVLLMEERYKMMENTKTKKISEFNDWVDDNPERAQELGYEKVPYLICTIDEYADMVDQFRDVEGDITRLGQKSRAAGIHLLIATQRPSADVVSPRLKSNIPSRICLKTTDSTNSQIIIDQPGGEDLTVGASLVKDSGGIITRVQGPYISEEEMARIFQTLRDRYKRTEVDYKSYVVNHPDGGFEWCEEYDDDVPPEKRHIQPQKRRRSMR